jgi:hypothetical protein
MKYFSMKGSLTVKEQNKIGLSIGILSLIFIVALFAQFYAPSPWKQWGGVCVLVLTASLLVSRAIQVITGDSKLSWLPYIIATFLVLAPLLVFAQGLAQLVAGIVFAALVGIAGFYWIVAIIVQEIKSVFARK